MSLRSLQLSAFLLGASIFLPAAVAQTTASVTVDVNHNSPRATPIPSDFPGMSFEMDAVRYDYTGGTNVHVGWLDGTNGVFTTLLKTLGVKSIRIGGNQAENGTLGYPSGLDSSHVNDFVNNIGANLIWTLPVGSTRYNVSTYTSFADAMNNNKLGKGQNFQTVWEIGNEPQNISITPQVYETRFKAYLDSLKANINNSVLLGGTSGDESYTSAFVTDPNVTGSSANIGFVFAHSYPQGGASDFSDVNAAIDKLLNSRNDGVYEWLHGRSNQSNWAYKAVQAGFKPRLEETNSIYGGGYVGASNTFAAALWALDYMTYLATQTDVVGVNFHEGHKSGPGAGGAYNVLDPVGIQPSYDVRGVGYALLTFKQFGQGRALPVTLTNPNSVNLTAYGVLRPDASESVVLINRTHSSSTSSNVDVTATIHAGSNYGHAQVGYLLAPNSDPTALTGITLGGQSITSAGTWSGAYTTTTTIVNGTFTVTVPHTSAAVVHFY